MLFVVLRNQKILVSEYFYLIPIFSKAYIFEAFS